MTLTKIHEPLTAQQIRSRLKILTTPGAFFEIPHYSSSEQSQCTTLARKMHKKVSTGKMPDGTTLRVALKALGAV